MPARIKDIVVGICLAVVILINQGCIPLMVGAAVGAGGFAYIKGNLEQNLDYPVKSVYEASLKALKNLDVEIYKKELSPHLGLIYGYRFTPEKKRIRVTVQALTERASNIKIRVGIVGDESQSIEILEEIKKFL